MPGPSSTQIRQQFIDFFVQKHGHAHVPSSPVVPHDDPTLLFANAGMNQFKPIFLGEEPLTTYGPPRAANSQKCIRAGGKHNDLDDVGRDSYHHTFFEMLGNWSFGDYFKTEAVDWAWELLTEVWGLDPERLHATYFEGDPSEGLEPDLEAKELWSKYLPAERIHPGNKKDNFWEMGDVGPCGPCSEIHYDRSDGKNQGKLVNADDQDVVVEIWNLVFIQFNRTASGLKPLPHKHVDTGMGFERMCRILQGAGSNYETDVFQPLLDQIAELTGKTYNADLSDPVGIAFRAIADHARMATFAIADGARPGPQKADSVLRSVIRRAARYGYTQLDQREPFLHKLVPTIVEQMGEAFPEIREQQDKIAKMIEAEEADFLTVIDRGLKTFADAAKRAKDSGGKFSGKDLFDLHTEQGFPSDMAMQMARDEGLTPDVDDYQRRFKKFQDDSRGDKVAVAAIDFGDLPDTDDAGKYDCINSEAAVLAFVKGDAVATEGDLTEGMAASVLLDRTCFYAEQGGQVGDTGVLRCTEDKSEFLVEDTKRLGNRVLHVGRVTTGTMTVGGRVTCHVNNRRTRIMANHSATHLLNLALRQTLGDHVAQAGSYVGPDRLRFDISHPSQIA
ncbi:MAG: alanine--tRNA ligase, partial [Planctomycetota bacterium]